MKIAFFEVEPWEKGLLEAALKGHELSFFEHALTPATAKDAAETARDAAKDVVPTAHSEANGGAHSDADDADGEAHDAHGEARGEEQP